MSVVPICRFAVVAFALLLAPSLAVAEEAEPEAIVDALNGVFGKHAGQRAAHPKGICVKGSFEPSPEAASLTKAPVFASPVPLGGGSRSQAAIRRHPTVSRTMRAALRCTSNCPTEPPPTWC